MADEKRTVDIGTYYAKQEIVKFASTWNDAAEKINSIIDIEEPDCDALAEIIRTVDLLKKAVKPMSYMALLLSKQKACETFLEEKGLSDEFLDFATTNSQK